MDVAWTSKQRRVLTGQCYHIQFVLLLQSIQHRIVFYWKKNNKRKADSQDYLLTFLNLFNTELDIGSQRNHFFRNHHQQL